MKKFEKLRNDELAKYVGGRGSYNCYKFGRDVGRAVKLIVPIVVSSCFIEKSKSL